MSNEQKADWHAGWNAFVNGKSFDDNKSMQWAYGYADAKLEQELELQEAEESCLTDYDKGPGYYGK